jgi:predicted nucleic acid-binding Zn ribbon protein
VKDPVPITASIDSIMSSLRGTDRVQIGGVFGRWVDAVGENIADHVRPVRLDQRVLTVEVEEAAWATQVTFLSANIIQRLHDVAGVDVDRVDVRVRRTGGADNRR